MDQGISWLGLLYVGIGDEALVDVGLDLGAAGRGGV
jgi:hypothetical protein